MRVAILSDGPDLSAYLAEIFNTWGLVLYEVVGPDRISELDPEDTPVVVCPAFRGGRSLIDFACRGGTVICFLPEGSLAEASGLVCGEEKEVPLRLRVTEYPAAGMAGERFPIVGRANNYSPAPGVQVLGYLSLSDCYEGESVGITETVVGQGRIVAFAFDLALCVLLLRQGDPNRAEVIPGGTECARPSSMAIDIGPLDSGWVPFADLLSRLLVDTVRRCLPGPVPFLSHLPGMAPGILLYSGDEDNADVTSNDAEFECVAAAGGRMNLYIIPNRTQSTVRDVDRYPRSARCGSASKSSASGWVFYIGTPDRVRATDPDVSRPVRYARAIPSKSLHSLGWISGTGRGYGETGCGYGWELFFRHVWIQPGGCAVCCVWRCYADALLLVGWPGAQCFPAAHTACR